MSMDYNDSEFFDRRFKEIEELLKNIYNALYKDDSKGFFSNKKNNTEILIEIRDKLDRFFQSEYKTQPNLGNINFDNASISEIRNYVAQMLTVVKNLQQNQINVTNEIKNSNSLVAKAIERLQVQNAKNNINSAFIDANSNFANIIALHKQSLLTKQEAIDTMNSILSSLRDILNSNKNVITLEDYNSYNQKIQSCVKRSQNSLDTIKTQQ